MKPLRALRASVPVILARMTGRVVRSTKAPTADPLRAPLMRSLSQWPGTVRVPPQRGVRQWASCWGSGPVARCLATEADARCAPDATRPTVRSAGLRVAAHTCPHRWSRPKAVSGCRQDTRVGAVRQSVRASSPRPDVSGHTATARDPGVCAIAAADEPEPMPGCAPYRPDKGRASRCGRARGSRCWAFGPALLPSLAANGPGAGPSSPSHALRHSGVYRVSFAW